MTAAKAGRYIIISAMGVRDGLGSNQKETFDFRTGQDGKVWTFGEGIGSDLIGTLQ
jgi:hypothetical protein